MIFIDYHENEVDEALHLEGKEDDVETSYDLKFGHEVEGEEIDEEEEEDKKVFFTLSAATKEERKVCQ